MGLIRLLLVTTLAVAVTAAASASATVSTARVRFVSTQPVTVRGTGFASRERVRVVLAGPAAKRARAVLTTRRGTFTVSFGTVAGYDPCNDTLSVTAVGRTGDRAAAKLPQRQCPPALAGP